MNNSIKLLIPQIFIDDDGYEKEEDGYDFDPNEGRDKGKRQKWESYCLCDYAETGSHYFWYSEIHSYTNLRYIGGA
jgi:hypothetical protein